MAFQAGKGQVFKLDTTEGGALVDISAYIESADFPQEVDLLDTTTWGDSAREFIPGLKNGTISLNLKFDSQANSVDPLFGVMITAQTTTRSFEYGPEGSTAGKVKYSGECFCSRYTITGSVDGLVTATAELQVSGAVTRGTF